MLLAKVRQSYDIAVIGGGWFGCAIADHLKDRYRRILIVEREAAPMTRASYNNQARVHNGYHYPRNLQTAYRSRVNFKLFARDYADSLVSNFTKLYGIASRMSKVTPQQFERFCGLIRGYAEAGAAGLPADVQPPTDCSCLRS